MSDQWNEKAREIWKDIERQQVFEDLSQCALKLPKEHAIAAALRSAVKVERKACEEIAWKEAENMRPSDPGSTNAGSIARRIAARA